MPFGTKDESLSLVEIVVTNRGATITGIVSDARNRQMGDYTVVAVAADRQRWYPQSRFMAFARPGPDGGFVVRGLPPAEYFVMALDRMQGTEASGEWQDPMFLDLMAPKATRVILAEGQRLFVGLTLIER